MTKLDQVNVWKIVEKTRNLFLSEHNDPECQDDDTLLSDEHIKDNLVTFEKNLKLNNTATSTPVDNVSYKILETAAQMFTYLNYCPPKLYSFFRDIKQTASPKEILSVLVSMLRVSSESGQKISNRIFTKAMEMFNPNPVTWSLFCLCEFLLFFRPEGSLDLALSDSHTQC